MIGFIKNWLKKDELIVTTNTPEEFPVGQTIEYSHPHDPPAKWKITRWGKRTDSYGGVQVYGKRAG